MISGIVLLLIYCVISLLGNDHVVIVESGPVDDEPLHHSPVVLVMNSPARKTIPYVKEASEVKDLPEPLQHKGLSADVVDYVDDGDDAKIEDAEEHEDQKHEDEKHFVSESHEHDPISGHDNSEEFGDFTGALKTTERSTRKFFSTGWVFNGSGRAEFITADMTSSLIHSFSPYVEQEAAKRFIDPPHSNTYVANSPAVLWYHGELVFVCRIWLVREKYEPKSDWPANHFADNYFYTQKFDRSLRPISNGSIMGIPTPKQWWVGDGPIEPRLCAVQDHLYVTFNTAMALTHKQAIDFTMMWDYHQNLPIIPEIKGGSPMFNSSDKDQVVRDKHWMALIQDDQLYFVHNLDPLRIMKCTLGGYCEFVHFETNKQGFVFDHHTSHLRGGTPFELYQFPYYISVAHSTMYKESNRHRYYAAHLVVLCVKPYRIVYVGDALKVHPDVYRDAPMVRPRWIDDGFVFPVGLLLETDDWMTIGVHVNDFSSVLIRFKGLKQLMKNIIAADQKHNLVKPDDYKQDEDKDRYGPPIGYLHKHLHEAQENITHIRFANN